MRTHDHVIDKADIPRLGALKGRVVRGGPFDGLAFLGFAGRRFDDGRWHGVLRFEPASEPVGDSVSWDSVLGGGRYVTAPKPPVVEEDDDDGS